MQLNKVIQNKQIPRYWLYAFGFVLIKFSLHLFTNTNYELHRDEMLYFNMADHPAFGYATVPPMIGFLALFAKTIFGYSVFGLRLMPAMAGAFTLLIIAKIIWDLNRDNTPSLAEKDSATLYPIVPTTPGGPGASGEASDFGNYNAGKTTARKTSIKQTNSTAKYESRNVDNHNADTGVMALIIASTAFILSPGFLLFNTLFTPNAFEQLLWLIIIYFIFKLANTGNTQNWIWLGIATGIALLTKYSVVFLIIGFIVAIVLSPHRKLMDRKLIIAIAIALLIFLPNIIWQYQHNWPVVKHMGELKKTQLVNTRYTFFLEDIFSLTMGAFFISMYGLISMLFFRAERRFQFIATATLITSTVLLLLDGKGYYILGVFPFLIAYGSYALEKYIIGRRLVLGYVVAAVIVTISLPSLPYSLPIWSFEKLDRYTTMTHQKIIFPFSRWEDGKERKYSQVFFDMTGWNQLAGVVSKSFYDLPPEDQKKCTIYVERNYGDAGAIYFYGKHWNLPQPVTFHESYVFWAPGEIKQGPMLYVNVNANGLDKVFNSIREVGVVRDPYFREDGVKVYLCTEPKVNFQKAYREKAIAEKKVFKRQAN